MFALVSGNVVRSPGFVFSMYVGALCHYERNDGRSYQDANRDWRKNRRKKLAPKSAQGSQNTPAPILAYFLR